jgi:hypothetical protein
VPWESGGALGRKFAVVGGVSVDCCLLLLGSLEQDEVRPAEINWSAVFGAAHTVFHWRVVAEVAIVAVTHTKKYAPKRQ